MTGTIRATGTVTVGASASFFCALVDGTGEIRLLLLGRTAIPGLVVGARCGVEGAPRMGGETLVIWNPLYRLEPAE